MPDWGQIPHEFNQSAADRGPNGPDSDGIRLKYLRQLHEHTRRAVIVYASAWLQRANEQETDLIVEPKDVHALMEACHEVPERQLDIILHSPGGSPAAAEQMVNYLRTQFDHIRAIVPLQAKSAATMIALGCDEIVLGSHSELGPIDPQILMPIPGGARWVPAHAVLRDFERAKQDLAKDVSALPAWTPVLHQYAGGLLEYCHQQISYSQDVVAGWLGQFMLAHADSGVPAEERSERAKEIAEHFGSERSYDRFKEHGRPIRIEELEQIAGLRVHRLETDNEFQDAVLSIFHALDITFGGPAIKIVENHRGKRYVRARTQIIVQTGPAGAPNGEPGTAPRQPPHHPPAPRPKKRRR